MLGLSPLADLPIAGLPATGWSWSYSLSCSGGAYSITGGAATLKSSRGLSLSGGTYAYSGASATFVYGRKLPLVGGSYSYAGGSLSFAFTRKLSLSGGTYSYAGATATLTYAPGSTGYSLVCSGGTYSYSGSSASFVYVRKLTLSGGSYSYSGCAATLTYTAGSGALHYTLTAGGGIYAYSGCNTRFLTGGEMIIDNSAAIAQAIADKVLGSRTLSAHLQVISAALVGDESGAGTTHVSFTDGAVTVEADVPLPGDVGNRTNVTISGV